MIVRTKDRAESHQQELEASRGKMDPVSAD